MLTFDVSVTGGQVGRAMARDTEEIPYMLVELTEGMGELELGELADLLVDRTAPAERKRIAAFGAMLVEACK